MKKITLISLAAATVAFAGGYKIPESSVNAVALSSAYVANAHGADASYYNPAAMAFSTDKGSALELDLTYIGLTAPKYEGSTNFYAPSNPVPVATSTESGTAKAESFIVPTVHYVSPAVGDMRFGLSIVAPGGLSKRWEEGPSSQYAKEFTLETIEVNPTIAYKLNDKLSIGGGIRAIYSTGVVKTNDYLGTPFTGKDMDGKGLNWGYNLALNIRPNDALSVALTYRSTITMQIDGDDKNVPTANETSANVRLPMPGEINMAAAYTFDTDTTVEVTLTHTMWSAYDKLDFDYDDTAIEGTKGGSLKKNWEDTQTIRLGLTQEYDAATAMFGLAYDPTPVPNSSLGYELPDSDALIVSLGGRYDITEDMNIGLAALISKKNDRKVNNAILTGEFTNSTAYLVSAGLEYKF